MNKYAIVKKISFSKSNRIQKIMKAVFFFLCSGILFINAAEDSNETKASGSYISTDKIENQKEVQQKKEIVGKVIDSEGIPIIGANVLEMETTNGTITDIDGNFSLNISQNSSIK